MMDLFRFWFPTLCRRVIWIATLTCLIALNVAAQTSSTITGDIKDSNGAVLVGVKVTATHLDTRLTRTTTSEEGGRFVFPGLPVGIYRLDAESAGFEPLAFPNVVLTVNETTAVELVM